ncbi:MAG: lipoprotein signal peptidase [Bacteroidota bacterium]
MKNKLILSVSIILAILLIDQWVKYYIKTHFFLGEEVDVLGNWFKIHFTENYGMAFGMEFGGKSGKLLLTLFRVIAIGFIGWYIFSLTKKNSHTGYIISWTLIMAGAIGNLIDSIFYGVWFGYDTWLHGRVVDMFYFPIIRTTLPEGFPLWGGEDFEFFRPVFNIADAAISIGFIAILLFQRTFMKAENSVQEDESTPVNENQV